MHSHDILVKKKYPMISLPIAFDLSVQFLKSNSRNMQYGSGFWFSSVGFIYL